MKPFYKENVRLDEKGLRFKCFLNSADNLDNNPINVHPHWHDLVEILYVERGAATQYINDNIFEISKGDIVIIKGQDIHGTFSKGKTDIWVYQFCNSIICENNIAISKNYGMFSDLTDLPMPISSGTEQGMEIHRVLEMMKKVYSDKKTGWELMVVSGFALILAVCLSEYPQMESVRKQRLSAKESLKRIFEYTDENYNKNIMLKDIAKMSNYSIPHFSRIFKNCTGMSYFDYLSRYRIEVSIGMLSGESSITEIAMECGFSSINSFIRVFKKITGTSPGAYRQKLI